VHRALLVLRSVEAAYFAIEVAMGTLSVEEEVLAWAFMVRAP
jgi:hypothetical protein